MAPSIPPASPVFVTALQKQQQESTRRRREQRAFNIAHGTPAASIASLGIPKAPVTPAIYAIDPVTNEPFEQVHERLVEAAYIADPGYFVLTRHGCIYHFWHRSETFLRDQRTLFIHPNLAFKIDCRDPQRPATYAYIYTRWYFTYFMKLPWPDLVRFAREHGLITGEQCDFLGKPGLRLCIWHARQHFEETKDRKTTETLLDELDWDAAVPYCQLRNERPYKGEDVWNGFWRAPPPKQYVRLPSKGHPKYPLPR
ncbi:hypothetical protein W97_03707 [Coniosporium apollinis CBS 100218]|uniref:Uncharacterized protein n=1 Tax=Coniosporium apollinis (strain CBS 100218) TaxID=1168221 RepID=R7YRD0_CONA1|nr:uncharacterized protein W97_03707 [Coniosporium apollinis CBS 100218]EON64475.1 hypothetical protein W97_03707 [Coniosporium apollinis CBS 100218]